METRNEAWGRCIRNLLKKHDLSYRAASLKAGRPSLKSYLSDWTAGQIPSYNLAVDFLSHFPVEDSIECLQAAGYPVPPEWTVHMGDPAEAVRFVLSGRGDLTEREIKKVADFVRSIVREKEAKAKAKKTRSTSDKTK